MLRTNMTRIVLKRTFVGREFGATGHAEPNVTQEFGPAKAFYRIVARLRIKYTDTLFTEPRAGTDHDRSFQAA